MNTITVSASKDYQVLIGNGLLTDIGLYAKEISKPGKVAIISDTNVYPIYGATVQKSLSDAGFSVCSFVLPAGEQNKNGENYLSILDFLAENKVTRSDLLIALGGGVVGDITGFSAATFLRGVPYIQIPTSLLAMVDSSVGGKTAIDLPAGKNLAGAFYQPSLVLCDLDTLVTLPTDYFIDGCAEVIKYGILYDADLFAHLLENGIAFNRKDVVSRCVALKRDVVAHDEFDRGERQKLNLGHTIGHAVELSSNFAISHGRAVAIGMAMVAKAANTLNVCGTETYQAILQILQKFSLPSNADITAEQLNQCALSDKKRAGGIVNLIIPREIGNCVIQPTQVTELLSFIEAGL